MQIGTVQDQFLGFAVAEFSTIVAAQRTFGLLHGSGRVHSVRVSFAVPGETIAEVFSSMVTMKVNDKSLLYGKHKSYAHAVNACTHTYIAT